MKKNRIGQKERGQYSKTCSITVDCYSSLQCHCIYHYITNHDIVIIVVIHLQISQLDFEFIFTDG